VSALAAEHPEGPEPRWATLKETAVYARVSVNTLRRWIHTGRLTATRNGPRRIEVDLNQVDKLRTPITPTDTE
jgi:excisionase family DNA binding protein